jgi:hypothetical protein
MATIEDLRAWVERDFRRSGGWDRSVGNVYFDITRCQFRIFTDINRYTINARDPMKLRGPDEVGCHYDNGYLGCTAMCRKPRAGEDWNRGNDLADGPLSEKTWHAILADIVSYELVRIHAHTEAAGAPEAVPAAPPPDDPSEQSIASAIASRPDADLGAPGG